MVEQTLPECEASIHEQECERIGSTKDHFTPRSIARLLDWSIPQMNDERNIQKLSEACHKKKDEITPLFIERIERLQNGGSVTLWEHHNDLLMLQKRTRWKEKKAS